jgi:hypothetical protein
VTENKSVPSITWLVERYFAMWNETDPQLRRAVIAETWEDNAGYTDPLFTAEGHEGLDAMVAAVHKQYPGYRFSLVGAVDAHHDRVRWDWELAGPAGNPPAAAGIDFATITPDGRLREVTGFFKQPAEAA